MTSSSAFFTADKRSDGDAVFGFAPGPETVDSFGSSTRELLGNRRVHDGAVGRRACLTDGAELRRYRAVDVRSTPVAA